MCNWPIGTATTVQLVCVCVFPEWGGRKLALSCHSISSIALCSVVWLESFITFAESKELEVAFPGAPEERGSNHIAELYCRGFLLYQLALQVGRKKHATDLGALIVEAGMCWRKPVA